MIDPSHPQHEQSPDLLLAAVPGGLGLETEVAARVRSQQEALLEIMQGQVLAKDLSQVFPLLTEVAARTLSVARVSVWHLSEDKQVLELCDLYDGIGGSHADGTQLSAIRYPAYFDALMSQRVISASDAQRNPATREFKDDYLVPLHIHSMLDAAIWYDGTTQGVVCVESVGERREWTPDEQMFAGSIADLVVLALENDRRRVAQNRLSDSEHRFSQVFRLSPDWMVITRLSDGAVLEVNESFESQSGYRSDEVIGRTTRELGLWVDVEQREALYRQVREGNQLRGLEAELRLKSGVIRTFQISTERIVIAGEPCLISINRDITDSKRQQRLVFEIAQGVAAATGETFFRSLVERLLQALGADLAFIGEVSGEDREQIRTIAVQKRDGPAPAFAYDLDGSPCETILGQGVCAYPRDVAALFPRDKALADKHIEGYVGAPLVDSSGCALGLMAVLFTRPLEQSELAVQLLRIFAIRASAELERRRQLEELEFRATHDMLTRLMNRATLERGIDRSIADGHAGGVGALLMLDLDRFKEVNDTLGHAVGDSLLVRIAKRLVMENSVGNVCTGDIARLGGDEFAVWLTGIEAAHIADLVASRALSAVTAPFDIDGIKLEVGVSIGIALYPAHGGSASELMRCADIAMYAAKRKGAGYARYEAAQDSYSPKRLALMGELGDAVRAGQLEVNYQPRLTLASGITSGFEALVRWRHPVRGLVPPGEFIPLAEMTDVIRPLTLAVLDESLRQVAEWSRQERRVTVAVNLSARHLMDESCPHQVRRLLEKHGVDPALLELEITESAIIVDPARAIATLKHIHDMGVKIAIDDFGTGYSSLSHLRRMPLHALKIDVSFVTHMLQNEQDAVIVESTIGLAHNLGLTVVAEGIEDEPTLKRLRELGCEEGQGYFIARPMNAAAASDWLQAQAAISNKT
ncbi:MAG: EAL domain-containing protein [Betaproteobacteria bacterium]|nr:EAL domain-containing protein [Betaproteobacteria bacterium]